MSNEIRHWVRAGILVILLVTHHSLLVTAQPISIALKDSSFALLCTDSTNWNEAWIEIDGAMPGAKALGVTDLVVSGRDRVAEVLSVDSIGAKYKSHLALSFVLDNSGSMFHAYDSLTKYCDSMIAGLPPGVSAQVVTFDNAARTENHLYTRRASVFIAQSGFRDSLAPLRAFWHFYDTIRTQYTPLYDAIAAAATNIHERRSMHRDAARSDVLLVITDGDDNASRTSIETLKELLSVEHLRLFAINFRTEADNRLQWLARHTGGKLFVADGLSSLRSQLRKIGLSLTREYHVTYRFPSLGPSSGFH